MICSGSKKPRTWGRLVDRGCRGQALVEAALVIPVACLALVVTVQIVASCYNAVLLQRMAYTAARDGSSEERRAPSWLSHNPLWGRGAFPVSHTLSEIPHPWRSAQAPTRVTTAGWIRRIDIQSFLLPTGGFGRGLGILKQEGTAEAFIEPPIPGEE
jgi:hypothetical protein